MSGHGAEVPHDAEDGFTKTVALCVAVFAVGLAFASFGGHDVSKEMMVTKQEEAKVATLSKQDETNIENLAKQDEFNKWTQFQAKSTREALYRNEQSKLEAEKEAGNFPPAKEKLLAYYIDQAKRMEADKKELAAEAKAIQKDGEAKVKAKHDEGEKKVHDLETAFKKFQRKDAYFDYAEIAFQLSLVMASVAMLGKKWWAFLVSVALAVVAVLLTVNGFFLLMAVPGIEHAPHAAGH